MKILFLDIDGVLNSTMFYNERIRMKEYESLSFPCDNFDYRAISLLNDILDKTQAKLVISSDWRFDEDLESCLKYHGLNHNIYGKTPYDKHYRRGYEIQKYLLSIGNKVDKFCIIDDIDNWFLPYQMKYVVKTTFNEGLTKELAEKAINILNDV